MACGSGLLRGSASGIQKHDSPHFCNTIWHGGSKGKRLSLPGQRDRLKWRLLLLLLHCLQGHLRQRCLQGHLRQRGMQGNGGFYFIVADDGCNLGVGITAPPSTNKGPSKGGV